MAKLMLSLNDLQERIPVKTDNKNHFLQKNIFNIVSWKCMAILTKSQCVVLFVMVGLFRV